ncbi:hypothetical protein IU500_36060 [Nocardia terpenica]|uniref:hypothetical protein n=1 Tax=Nocardia terpenica TaxID=455432 RepID=UPI001895541D|nr:hypothetical protein [Nocardia terpenica]MBF6066378.1 hypothetical protein [Nocardia terpenica]MBF6109432.1 hypothetical protein [Nocardia terpenica]MBF6116625.1 hypothetical protein [Nocardia terpenica]MBF6123860.1 hypothetical protein [Nocardia terpenica]MBF6157210.1 hypothetical protein [Nocardia terpenica]
MGARGRPLPGHVSGELVRVALMEARPEGLTLVQLVSATGLTPAQVRTGLRWIRTTAASEHLTPLIYRRAFGHGFPDDPAEWIAFERAQFLSELTRLTSLFTGCLDPHRQRQPADGSPGDEWITLVLRQVAGVQATLEVIVKMKVAL